MPWWITIYIHRFGCMQIYLQDKLPEVWLLGERVNTYVILLPTGNIWKCLFPEASFTDCVVNSWIFAKLINEKCYLNVVLIFIYLMCEIEHLLNNLRAICISFSVKYLCSLAISLRGCWSFQIIINYKENKKFLKK